MKMLLVILTLLSAFASQGQIKNAGFEHWHTVPSTGGAEDPDFWESNNKGLDSVVGYGVSKSTDAHSGNYALELTPTLDPARSAQIVLGKLSLDSLGYPKSRSCAGYSIAHLPLVVTGYYKYYGYNSRMSAEIDVAFTEGCTNSLTHVLAWGSEQLSPSPNKYRPFAIAINFEETDPFTSLDTMRITISLVDPDTNGGNSFLLIDDLSVLGKYVGTEESGLSEDQVRIFPNPTEGPVTIENGGGKVTSIKIFSAYGKLLKEQKTLAQGQLEFSIDGPAGMYFVEVGSPAGNQVFQVLKE